MACATLMPWMPPWGETLSGMLWIDCRSDASVRSSPTTAAARKPNPRRQAPPNRKVVAMVNAAVV